MRVRTSLLSFAIAATALSTTHAAEVSVNVNVKRSVGGISTFDREKFITIHSNHDNGDWRTDNVLPDLMDDFLNGNDVYFGRNTGGLTWYSANQIDEDPLKAGWPLVSGSYYSYENRGASSRSSYNGKTWAHAYAHRAASDILCAQWHPFWPDGTLTARGWAPSQINTLAEPFGSASGYMVGQYYTNFYANADNGNVGHPQPGWVEVINEPEWELWGWDPPDTAQELADAEKLWTFHNSMAQQIKAINGDQVKVGGYCTAFPDHENGDFLEWEREWKAYIDHCGTNLDFYSIHFYDFNEKESLGAGGGNTGGYSKLYRRGSNLEATLDMIEQYSQIKLGEAKPFVVSEYGGRARNLESGAWSEKRDWQTIKSLSSMLMSFADRPNLIGKTIPFIMLKEEWAGTTPTTVHSWRLMRRQNEPTAVTGNWVYTEMVKFYQLWSEVRGTRVDITTDDPDVQIDAYVDGDRAYVILNNLGTAAKNIDLNLFEGHGNGVSGVLEKSLHWGGSEVALDETSHPTNVTQVALAHEGTTILRYDFAASVVVDETSDEVKHYATTYYQPITAGVTNTFQINGVAKGAFGEAVLRLGMGRSSSLSKQPTVLVNGVAVAVTPNFMGSEGDGRSVFFGQLNIPVPYDLLQANNTIEVTYPDSGGHISSVALRAYAFSSDLRGTGIAPSGVTITAAEVVGTNYVLYVGNGNSNAYFDVVASDDLMTTGAWPTVLAGEQLDGVGEATVPFPMIRQTEFFRVHDSAFIPVSGVSVTPASANLAVGQQVPLAAGVSPSAASDTSVTWSSSAPSVATVDAAGIVSAVGAGNATITATTVDGGFTDTCGVAVAIGTSATFDWEEHGGNWWTNYGLSETNNGAVLLAGGRAAAHPNGYAVKASYSQDSVDGTFVVQVGGADKNFVVLSIDVSASLGPPEGAPLVRGMLGGVEQWSIDPAVGVDFQTYTTATTGNLSIQIDEIVWSAPYDSSDAVLTWDNKIDNLSVLVLP